MAPHSPLPNLTVQQLDYLVAAVDRPTHAEAADHLGVTPSALSQGLTELGRRLGVELFERRGRTLEPRAEAAPIIAHARRVIADTAELASHVADLRAGRTGRVRLGMIDVAAVHHFAAPLHDLRVELPDVDLWLTVAPSSELLAGVLEGRLDAAVIVTPDGQGLLEGLEVTAAVDEPLYVYAGPEPVGVFAEGIDPLRPATWGPWVAFPTASHTSQLIGREIRRLGGDYDVVAESHQPDVLKEMVDLGMGWVVLPAVQAETPVRPLRRVSDTPLLTRRLSLVRRDTLLPSPALADVLGRLVDGARTGGAAPLTP